MPFGPLTALTFGNGYALTRAFDQQYRLTDQTTGAVQDLGFTLDAAGNIDAIADGVNAGLSQGFAQDALHRVTTDAGAYGTKSFTYDSAGNRLTRTHGAFTQTLTYTASSNRLATHSGNTVSRDAAGNTLADPTENLSFTYGAHNRMLEAYVGAVLKASYVYNGAGQRVKKIEAVSPNRTIVYHYGPGGELLGETIYSSAGAKIGERDYVWLDSLPLAQAERTFSGGTITSSQFVYLHADQLNTPRLATNGTGTVVWRWDSDAFGIGAANQDPDADTNLVNVRLRFPGQYLDEETGLNYNYFRDYDAVTGRYVQSDPIGLRGGLNSYGYVSGNPLAWADPYGLDRLINPRPAGPTGPTITFNNDVPGGPSTNLPVTDATAEMIERAVAAAGLDININSTRGGTHSRTSRHLRGMACDINEVGGKGVDDATNLAAVRALQDAFNLQPNIRENFGPALTTRTESNSTVTPRPDMARTHQNHIHVSGQR